ncbi:hypothetical protein BDQ12DRAFT_686125 [Crucibulum laeve]|uniref:Uncharacterized protein n=1 Tax=Crucibulum laeve TaxID=68775 RepID=A0A5C3LVD2_9AGAR|nr:hypothetical protein BDQ12DRAFT_686125 [Crucibulum laeve]
MNRSDDVQVFSADLPVGVRPGWEVEEENDDEKLKTIPESSVIAYSLKQSRERWLHHVFPRFSRSRGGKATDVPTPPPHTIQMRGKCDLEIGPHVFPDTIFYEVHYLSSPNIPSSHNYQPTASKHVPTSTSYPSTSSTPTQSTPLASSLTSMSTITPALINQVNSAASSNPTLAKLLQLAAAGDATPDQLKTLGLLIQTLASAESSSTMPFGATSSSNTFGTYQQMPLVPPVKEFDVVLEFRETPLERRLFPHSPSMYESTPFEGAENSTYDILLSVAIPFEKLPRSAADNNASTTPISPPQSVTFGLKKSPATLLDTISRWIGGEEKMDVNRKVLQELGSLNRQFLAYQLPIGHLQLQLHSVNSSLKPLYVLYSYLGVLQMVHSHASMKYLKQAPIVNSRTQRQRRTTAQRKPVPEVTTQVKHTASTTTSAEPALPASKRRRTGTSKTPTVPIHCISCKQTDVPLILGGRFCRPCVDSGKADASMAPPLLSIANNTSTSPSSIFPQATP